MYGLHVDSLNVYVRYGQSDQLIWNRAGDNGNMWKKAQVDFLSKRDYQVSSLLFIVGSDIVKNGYLDLNVLCRSRNVSKFSEERIEISILKNSFF